MTLAVLSGGVLADIARDNCTRLVVYIGWQDNIHVGCCCSNYMESVLSRLLHVNQAVMLVANLVSSIRHVKFSVAFQGLLDTRR